jgi:hypothetical protein
MAVVRFSQDAGLFEAGPTIANGSSNQHQSSHCFQTTGDLAK